MVNIRMLPEFVEWMHQLKDVTARAAITDRIRRLQLGLFGDVEAVGEGVSELRGHVGAGWRVYFARRGNALVILLVGGAKRTQVRDIKRAKALASELD